MAWDDDKSTAADPDNPNADEQLTATEWDNHVTEGHFPSNELNFGVDANGDPVITDPQNADEVVFRYDRSAGTWVLDSLDTDTLNNADIANAASGKVPKSQGDGTLAFDSVVGGSTDNINPSFGVWRQPSTNRAALITVECKAETDGTNPAFIDFVVDESGGTTGDYDFRIATADESGGAGFSILASITVYVPDGAQYQINNGGDPSGNNQIFDARRKLL